MRHPNLADETRWLPYRDSTHRDTLLCLLAKARVDTADELFVPLYLLAAAGPHSECFVRASEIDFENLRKASSRMAPPVIALINLAEALYDSDAEIDLRKVLGDLQETPYFHIAMEALRMKWEI